MKADWKNIVRAVAPTLATAFGTPLAGAAVAALSDVLLGKPDGTEAEIAQAVSRGVSPEQLAAIKSADNDFALKMEALQVDLTKLYAADTQHARDAHKGDRGVYRLGLAILITFAGVMAASLIGAYQMLVGGIVLKDVAVVAAVFGFLGTVVGYVAANAQQVVAYFFGSSAGSKQKTEAMSDAFSRMGR